MFTVCTQPPRPELLDPEILAASVERLADATQAHGCSVPIYTLMPDHFHLIMRGCNEQSDTLAAMVAYRTRLGIWLNGHRPGLTLQKDFYDRVVRPWECWKKQAWYIANNPVRAKLTADPFAWPYTGSIGHEWRDVLG